MPGSVAIILYMISSIFFIRGIKLLGKADTAKKGNLMSSVGMLIAVLTVLFEKSTIAGSVKGYLVIAVGILLGGAIGAVWASKVEMTGMPELVALFNGFGGLSSMLVALAQFVTQEKGDPFTAITLGLTIAIGAVAFVGSIIAWGKLSGKLFTKFGILPGKNAINATLCVVGLAAILLYAFAAGGSTLGLIGIIVTTVVFLIVGFTLVISVGGGDMPVIISLLNAFSGLAAAFAGFAIGNTVLVVSGCLVGASGLILTIIMCKAMNSTMKKLLFATPKKSSGGAAGGPQKDPVAMSVEDAFLILEAANNVVFIPGYGMAVAQAQHAVKELCDKLQANDTEVNFAIHPVAGRMPGHMNVLLAEANVDYDMLKTSDELNPQMSNCDVAIVIGANDVVNPAALTDEDSPIYGMPIVNAYEARTVFVLKRGQGTGFSGIQNPLFTADNTVMIYGDAKNTISALVAEFDD